MKLGINQLMLLRRCLLKGRLGVYDVGLYYRLRRSEQRIAILEKLEFLGYLSPINRNRWVLTEEGKQILQDNLPKVRRMSNVGAT